MRIATRPVSLLVVAFTLLGSLLLVEQADTGTTAPDAAIVAQPLDDSVTVAHRANHNRPARPTNVNQAVAAAQFAGRDAQSIIDQVARGVGTVARRCELLLGARAQFIVRIDILIDLVPASEGRLLDIRARVLARIDAALAGLDCSISG